MSARGWVGRLSGARASTTQPPSSRAEPGADRPARSGDPDRIPLPRPGPRPRPPVPEPKGWALRVVLVSRDNMLAGALRSLIEAPGGVRVLDWYSEDLDAAIRHADVVIVDMPPNLHERTFAVIDGRFLGRMVVLLQEGEHAEALPAGPPRVVLYRPVQIGELWMAVTGATPPVTADPEPSAPEDPPPLVDTEVDSAAGSEAEAVPVPVPVPEPEASAPEASEPEPESVPEPEPEVPELEPEAPDPEASEPEAPEEEPALEALEPGTLEERRDPPPEAAVDGEAPADEETVGQADAAAAAEVEPQGLPVAESGRLIGLSGQELDPVIGPSQVAPGMDHSTLERLRGWGSRGGQPAARGTGPAPGTRTTTGREEAHQAKAAQAEARRAERTAADQAKAAEAEARREQSARDRAARAEAEAAAREEARQAKAAQEEARLAARAEAERERAARAQARTVAREEARQAKAARAAARTAAREEARQAKAAKAEAERLAREAKAEAERLAREAKAEEARKARAAQAEAEQAAREARAEEARRLKAEAEARQAAEEAKAEEARRVRAAQAEAERAAREAKAEEDRKAKAAQAEAERLARAAKAEEARRAKAAKAEAERVAREAKAEEDRKAKAAKAEAERLAREAKAEEAQRAKAAKEEARAAARAESRQAKEARAEARQAARAEARQAKAARSEERRAARTRSRQERTARAEARRAEQAEARQARAAAAEAERAEQAEARRVAAAAAEVRRAEQEEARRVAREKAGQTKAERAEARQVARGEARQARAERVEARRVAREEAGRGRAARRKEARQARSAKAEARRAARAEAKQAKAAATEARREQSRQARAERAAARKQARAEAGEARAAKAAARKAARAEARQAKAAQAEERRAAQDEAQRAKAAQAEERRAARAEAEQAKAAQVEARRQQAEQARAARAQVREAARAEASEAKAARAEERKAEREAARAEQKAARAEARRARAARGRPGVVDVVPLALVVVALAAVGLGAAGWRGSGGPDTLAGEVAVVRAAGGGGGLVAQDPRVGPIEPLHALAVGAWLRATEAGGSLEGAIREARVPSRFLLAGVVVLTMLLFLLLMRVGPGSGAAAGPGPAPPQLLGRDRRWRLGAAALAGGLVALDPVLVLNGRAATGTVLAVVLALGALAVAWGLPTRPTLRWLPLVAAVGGLALLVSPLALGVLAVPVAAELLQGRHREAWRDMAALGLGVGVWLALPIWVAGQGLDAGRAGWLLGRPPGRGAIAASLAAAPLTWLLVAAGLAAAVLPWRPRPGARSEATPGAARLLAWTATTAAGALVAIVLGYPAEQALPFAVPAAAVSVALAATRLATGAQAGEAHKGPAVARLIGAGVGIALAGLLVAQGADWGSRYGTSAEDGLARLVATVGGELPACSAVNASGPDDRARLLAAGATVTEFSDGPAALAAGVRYFVVTGATQGGPATPSLAAWVRQHGTRVAVHPSRSLSGLELWRVDAAPLDPVADALPVPDGVSSNTSGSACGGYRVVDGQTGRFYTAYRAVGGKTVLGRPLGTVWTSDGPALQAFDTMVLGAVPASSGPPAVAPIELPPLLAKLDVEAVADADIPLPSARPPVTDRQAQALLKDRLIAREYLGTDPGTASAADWRRARARFGRPLGLPQVMPDGAVRQTFERVVLELPADGGPARPAALGRLAVRLGLVPRQAMRLEPVPGLPARPSETRLDTGPLLRLVGGALALLVLAAGVGVVAAWRSRPTHSG